MLQIRLSKGPGGEGTVSGGGGGAKTPPAAVTEAVTVACPDHLVLADLPVAKSLGAVTSAAVPSRSVGRRSRRHAGQRVHFCIGCDFPIAIYGRLIPCEHAFCLACARSDSTCYICDERIQKIQTIKMMEGIFICAAPQCYKSFLKKSDFKLHLHETHAELLKRDAEKEGIKGTDAANPVKSSSTDLHKQFAAPEASTARAPTRPGFSPSSSTQNLDRDDKSRRHLSREQPSPRPPMQPRPPQFLSRQQQQPGDSQSDSVQHQGFDRPYNWSQYPQNFQNQTGLPQPAIMPQESSISEYSSPQPNQPPNFPTPFNYNQGLMPPPSFNYPAFSTEMPQQYFGAPAPYEMPRPESSAESGSVQGSVLGFPPNPAAGLAGFPDNFPRPWGMGLVSVPFEQMAVAQGFPEGYANLAVSQGNNPIFQGDFRLLPNAPQPGKESELQHSSSDQNDGKGMLTQLQVSMSMPLPLPPPPPLPPLMTQQQFPMGNFPSSSNVTQDGQGFGL